jgi:hypothetical protein
MRGDGPGHEVGVWLAEYLENVLAYLRDKGLDAAALQLFEAALDDSAALGVTRVPLDPALLRRLMGGGRRAGRAPEARTATTRTTMRARLLECALEVFTSRGFHSATITRVAQPPGWPWARYTPLLQEQGGPAGPAAAGHEPAGGGAVLRGVLGVDDVRGAVEQFIRSGWASLRKTSPCTGSPGGGHHRALGRRTPSTSTSSPISPWPRSASRHERRRGAEGHEFLHRALRLARVH